MSTERRRVRRRRVRLRVHMEPGGVSSMTADLTESGLFMYSARVHKPGTRVQLVIRLPDRTAEAVGVVQWAKRVPPHFLPQVRGGMGIRFTWISPELEAYLGHAVSTDRVAV